LYTEAKKKGKNSKTAAKTIEGLRLLHDNEALKKSLLTPLKPDYQALKQTYEQTDLDTGNKLQV